MPVHKLNSVNAFVVFDLDGASSSLGFVRCAPKLLVSSSAELARSATYTLALHGQRLGGATASINTAGVNRDEAVKAFVDEIAGMVTEGKFLPDAGKGITEADLASLRADDLRPEILFSQYKGINFQEYLRGASAVAAVAKAISGVGTPSELGTPDTPSTSDELSAVSPPSKPHAPSEIKGQTAAFEGFDSTGLAAATELAKFGAQVVALSTSAGCVENEAGFDIASLAENYLQHGENLVEHLGREVSEPHRIFSVESDIFFAGSKFGVVDHQVAELMQPRVLGSLHHLAFTTRGLVELQKKAVAVLPDFLCLGGPFYAEPTQTDSAQNPQDIIQAAQANTAALVEELIDHPEGIFLAACYKAEEFLLTWRDELPFGRPLAP